jgi:hypothetical protein
MTGRTIDGDAETELLKKLPSVSMLQISRGFSE